MVLDTSMSLLPCRSTGRQSLASKQDVQTCMDNNEVGYSRDCGDSLV